MSVTIPTVNDKARISVTVINNEIEDTKDKWIGDNNSNDEKANSNYIKQELKLWIIDVEDVNIGFVVLIIYHIVQLVIVKN